MIWIKVAHLLPCLPAVHFEQMIGISSDEGNCPMKQPTFIAAGAVLLLTAAGPALAGGDPANGMKIFKQKCGLCHTVEAGQNRVGPSLAGVIGRKAASIATYSYSDAMRNSGLTWDAATLNSYLAGPRAKVPGTKMTFAGLPQESDRADLISYLSTLK
jgi:cytochrome c